MIDFGLSKILTKRDKKDKLEIEHKTEKKKIGDG